MNHHFDQLITYIGNKRKIVPQIVEFVKQALELLGEKKLSCLDLFSGSGVVSRSLIPYASHIVAVDNEAYSKAINDCYLLTNKHYPQDALLLMFSSLQRLIREYVKSGTHKGEFFQRNYAPKDINNIQPGERCFYTPDNALVLDTCQRVLADVFADRTSHYETKEANEWLYNFFIAPLLAEASIHCNTCGVFKGFYKGKDGIGRFGGGGEDALQRILGGIEFNFPNVEFARLPYIKTEAVQCDVNAFLKNIQEESRFDFAYFDPPYNQHPYGSNYFMLNLLADKEMKHEQMDASEFSTVSGIPNNWNRSGYNKKKYAKDLLFEAISICPARFICLSYNSTGFIQKDEIVDYLQGKGSLVVKEIDYPSFRGSRNYNVEKKEVTEFLFMVDRKGELKA